jgi:hypothetical protein
MKVGDRTSNYRLAQYLLEQGHDPKKVADKFFLKGRMVPESFLEFLRGQGRLKEARERGERNDRAMEVVFHNIIELHELFGNSEELMREYLIPGRGVLYDSEGLEIARGKLFDGEFEDRAAADYGAETLGAVAAVSRGYKAMEVRTTDKTYLVQNAGDYSVVTLLDGPRTYGSDQDQEVGLVYDPCIEHLRRSLERDDVNVTAVDAKGRRIKFLPELIETSRVDVEGTPYGVAQTAENGYTVFSMDGGRQEPITTICADGRDVKSLVTAAMQEYARA